ncbi:MAG: hypothetical protein ABEJ42_07540 [Halobacteriaceae archaeon]
MRLDEYIADLQPEDAVERRRLAEEKSYEVLDYLEGVGEQVREATTGDRMLGSTAPSVFVGRHGYPEVSTGILSPVADADAAGAAELETNASWYGSLDIDDVLTRRSSLLNSQRTANVKTAARVGGGGGLGGAGTGNAPGEGRGASAGSSSLPRVDDVWDGFVGTQREVAIADRPVDVEIGLADTLDLEFDLDDVTTPTGPRAPADSADLAENPHVPRPVEKTLEDDDWNAEGAMSYLYRRGFDVYDVQRILSAGALGQSESRRLVPTRWSITAVDDTIGQYLHGQVRHNPSVDAVEVHANEYLGNRYWVVLAPGRWEFELVEMKSPGSVWNPDPAGNIWLGSASEGYEGRTAYVEETAGAYYASRLGVLEHLHERGRQAKCLVLREVSDDYWAPVGVWQIRESIRAAFEDAHGEAETFHDAVATVATQLPVGLGRLRQKSDLVAGLQASLDSFSG